MTSFKSTHFGKKVMMVAMLFSLLMGFATASSAAQVAHRGVGSWTVQTGTSPAYWESKGFWVDATIENLGATKEVALIWTDDDWVTSQTSYLSYEHTLASGFEVWGIDFNPLGRLDSYYIGSWTNYVTNHVRAGGQSVTIKYALRYKVNGNTYWDSNGGANYSLLLSL